MTSPPSGTLTFPFTDIEGSTRRWESSPELMRIALARNDELVRAAIVRRGGYVFKTVVVTGPRRRVDWSPMEDRAAVNDRLLETLQQLLAIRTPELRPALDQASTLVADALDADKVDVFLHDAATQTLVAAGTSLTEMGRRQHELGLDRLPIANDGPVVRVFQTGEPYLTGRADEDPAQLRGTIEALGVRSEVSVPLEVDGERRGVLSVVSARPGAFTERDVRFLVAVADWIGMVAHRVETFERAVADAERRGQQRAAEALAEISRREREVATLVAAGLTNAEIGQRLVIVEGTVANHVEHILRKLKLRSRTQIATWAVEHGLYRSDLDVDA